MQRHSAYHGYLITPGFQEVDIMPLIGSVGIEHSGRTQQKHDLVACHADFKALDRGRVDSVSLRDIHSIHAAGECYNEAASYQYGS
jgi:hypothetical protein